MKRLILIMFVFLSFKPDLYSDPSDELIYSYMACMTSGVQADFSNKMGNITFSFDNNLTLLLLNLGINYKFQHSTNFFVGIGLGNIIQLQYGFPLVGKENLFRLRSDFPLVIFTNEKNSFLNYTHLGFYYINSDKKIHFNENYGITFSVNVNRAISKLSR